MNSAQACAAVREGALRAAPDAAITAAPVAAGHLMLDDAAVIESATTVGPGRLGPPSPTLARRAHSYGLGCRWRRSLRARGPLQLLVGLGGIGCTDGGTGALLALGARVWDRSGAELFAEGAVPEVNPLLARPGRVALPKALPCAVIGLADVSSPLLGPSGAACMFGPHKGVGPALIEELEYAMESWAAALREAGADVARIAGAGAAGAAGGLGAALLALGGRIESGLQRIAADTGVGEALASADLVITGEGSLDAQTGLGKVPDSIARLAKSSGRRGCWCGVVAVWSRLVTFAPLRCLNTSLCCGRR